MQFGDKGSGEFFLIEKPLKIERLNFNFAITIEKIYLTNRHHLQSFL